MPSTDRRACTNLRCPHLVANGSAATFDSALRSCTHCQGELSAPFFPENPATVTGPSAGRSRGVDLRALGEPVGPRVPIDDPRGAQAAVAALAVVGVLLGIMAVGFLAKSDVPLVGVALGLVAVAAVVVPPMRLSEGRVVRTHEHGIAIEGRRGPLGITFGSIRRARFVVTDVKAEGVVRIRFDLALTLFCDEGEVVLGSREQALGRERPSGPFFRWASDVVERVNRVARD